MFPANQRCPEKLKKGSAAELIKTSLILLINPITQDCQIFKFMCNDIFMTKYISKKRFLIFEKVLFKNFIMTNYVFLLH